MRTICEQQAGLREEAEANQIDSVIERSWNKILTTRVPLFDESYRKPLFCKILKHYYLYEIGFETVGEWKYNINMDLEELLPYFNQLYESEQLVIEPLINSKIEKNVSRETINISTGKETGNTNSSSTGRDSSTFSENSTNTQGGTDRNEQDTKNVQFSDTVNSDTDILNHRYSNTPQGTLSGIMQDMYLTEAAIDNNEYHKKQVINNDMIVKINNSTDYGKTDTFRKSGETTSNKTDTAETNTAKSITNNGSIDETGKEVTSGLSGVSQAELLKQYRDTFLNIDMLLIEKLKDNFMLIW